MQQVPFYLQGVRPMSYDTKAEANKPLFETSPTEQKIKQIAQSKPTEPTRKTTFSPDEFVSQVDSFKQNNPNVSDDEALSFVKGYYQEKGFSVDGFDISPQETVEDNTNIAQKVGGALKIDSKFEIDTQDNQTLLGSMKNSLKQLANAGRFAVNLPGDTIEFVGDIGNMILNPIDTVKGVAQLGDAIASKIGITEDNEQKQAIRNAVAQSISDNFGSFEKAMSTMEENPFDTLTTVFGGAGLAKVGLQKAGAPASVISKLDELSQLSNPLTVAKAEFNLGKAIIGKTVDTTTDMGNFIIGKTSGLQPSTLKTIFKNPDVLSSGVTRETNATKVLGALDTRLDELKSTGKGYEAMRSGKIVAKESDLIDATFNKVGDYNAKNLTKVDESVVSEALSYIDRYTGDITDGDLLSLRQQIDSLKYDPVTGAKRVLSPNGERIITQIRKGIDELAGEKIEGLKKLDSTYAKEVTELKDVKNLLFKKNGELKDNYIGTLSNLTSPNNLPKLQKIKKLVPEIETEINALKALEDVEFAKGRAVGAYAQGGSVALGVGGVVEPVTAIMLFTLSNPTVISNMVRMAGYGARTIGSITEKIKNGIKLTSQEAKIVSKAIQSQINEQALKSKEALGKGLDDLADKTGARAKFMDDTGKSLDDFGVDKPGYIGKTKTTKGDIDINIKEDDFNLLDDYSKEKVLELKYELDNLKLSYTDRSDNVQKIKNLINVEKRILKNKKAVIESEKRIELENKINQPKIGLDKLVENYLDDASGFIMDGNKKELDILRKGKYEELDRLGILSADGRLPLGWRDKIKKIN